MAAKFCVCASSIIIPESRSLEQMRRQGTGTEGAENQCN